MGTLQLPFDDNAMDVVVSTSVLEHAQNTEQVFEEINRVLKPGGCSIHLYPGKWYLPSEPHIFVPLVNFFWPNCPRWWLALWARLGVRNDFQRDLDWREVTKLNAKYCKTGLNYITTSDYRRISIRTFSNCEFPDEFLVTHSYGGFARLFRKLPSKKLAGFLSRECRMGLILQRKSITS